MTSAKQSPKDRSDPGDSLSDQPALGDSPYDIWKPGSFFARAGLLLGLIILLFIVAIVLVWRFVENEKARARADWQARLSIVADSRTAAVTDWLERQKKTVRSLSTSVPLRLYVTQLAAAKTRGESPDALPEAQFLANLLAVTASRTGYAAPPVGPNINANVPRQGIAGLSILNQQRAPFVATPGAPALTGALQLFVRSAKPTPIAMMDLTAGPGDHVLFGLMTPLYPPQTAARAGKELGYILAVRPVENSLFPLLRQPGSTIKSGDIYLVQQDGGRIRYLSPLRDGTKPLTRSMAVNAPALDAAAAITSPGGFVDGRNYAGRRVLSVSRKIPGTPWLLIYAVDRKEALGPSDARLSRLLMIACLALLLVFAGSLALWRHGASRRARMAAGHYREAAARLESQRNFLQVLTDSQPTAISIVDEKDIVRFANSTAAQHMGVDPKDATGKSLSALMGPDRARRYEQHNRRALEAGAPIKELMRIEDGQKPVRVLQVRHVPLAPSVTVPKGVLMVEEDVTAAITERERRTKSLRQLVTTLLTMVDRRDPNAANHSKRVSLLGRAIAAEMDLPAIDQETAAFAGALMNIGKLMIPEAILTRPGKLSTAELAQVREGLENGPALLDGIAFDGPVVETLQQAHERWDGRGRPKGLKGENILVTARIIAAANAFVAMASPRAHRHGLAVDAVLQSLQEDSGRRYDRRVISALIHYIDNRGGRAETASWTV